MGRSVEPSQSPSRMLRASAFGMLTAAKSNTTSRERVIEYEHDESMFFCDGLLCCCVVVVVLCYGGLGGSPPFC